MVRRSVQLEKDAITPTARKLWDAAREKLDEANKAIEKMEKARDRIDYEAAWSNFVDSIEEFWNRFYDEGKTTFSQFEYWIGAIVYARKSDPTLQYFHQARHQSQHGRIPMEWSPSKDVLGQGFSGALYGLVIYPDGTYEAQDQPYNPSGKPCLIEHSPGKPVLPTIENKRFNQVFPPPLSHNGKRLADSNPHAVARLVINYYLDVLKKGLQTFAAT